MYVQVKITKMNKELLKTVLTINLEGRLSTRREIEHKIVKHETECAHTKQLVIIPNQTIKLKVRNTSRCSINTILNEEATEYYMSRESRPSKIQNYSMFHKWNKLSETERLEYHLGVLCREYGGISFNYELV